MGRGAGGETKTKVPYMGKVWIFPELYTVPKLLCG